MIRASGPSRVILALGTGLFYSRPLISLFSTFISIPYDFPLSLTAFIRGCNRFGGTTGSFFFDGRDTGFSILLSGIQHLNRVLIKHIQKGLSLLSLPCVIWTCMRSKQFSLASTSYKKQIKCYMMQCTEGIYEASHRIKITHIWREIG